MHRRIQLIFVAISALTLCACANLSAGNLFSHYSAQNQQVYQAVKSGQYQVAEEALPDYVAGDILDNFERGRVYLLNQQYEQSKSALTSGDNAVRAQDDLATISLSETAASISALAVNDNLNIYQPSDYELGFLHLYLGINYIKENDLEGALVEMRRANQVQEKARKQREEELESAQRDLQAQGLTPNLGSVLSHYPDAGKTLQAVQNGYLLYLSALLYEADNDLNSAYVDYRRALAVMPDNASVIDGTKRVAKRLGMREDVVKLEERYGKTELLNQQQARVIVLEEQGVVEAMREWRQSLPLFDSRGNGVWYSVALPYYPSAALQQDGPLKLNGIPLLSDRLTDVNAMAQRDLAERMPTIIIRQALRVWAKDQLRREAAKKEDDIGNLVLNVWNTLTEQPDTRSWQTLPAQVHSTSAVVEPGMQLLQANGQTYEFQLQAGKTALVWVSRQGGNATIWHKQLGNIR